MTTISATENQTITFKGNPLHLTGNEINVGDRASDFKVVDNDLKPVTLANLKGKIAVLVAVPSLDTPVCDLESQKFNQKAAKMHPDVKVCVVSMDLPFAQKRWCGAHDIDKIQTLSDYQDRSFGKAFGVMIQELQLLARSVFILDRDGVVQYKQIVKEMTEEPNYDDVLGAIQKLI